MSNQMSLIVVLTALLSFGLLVLSAIELRKPSPVAKMTGFALMFFAIAMGSVSTNLFILRMTWHLLNAQKPWGSVIVLGGMAISFLILGSASLMRVVVARNREAGERDTEVTSDAEPQGSVWSPPPTGP